MRGCNKKIRKQRAFSKTANIQHYYSSCNNRGLASFPLYFIHCLQAPVNAIRTKWWEQSHILQLLQGGQPLWSFCGHCLTCIIEQPQGWLPANAPPSCGIRLAHLRVAYAYLHNKWDIPKHNIFMLYRKPPAHYHSSNLFSRKWIPHLHWVEIWKLIDKIQMDHWEPKCVENCSAEIKPHIFGEKRFIISGSFSQV